MKINYNAIFVFTASVILNFQANNVLAHSKLDPNSEFEYNFKNDQNYQNLDLDFKNVKGEKLYRAADLTKIPTKWATLDPELDKVEGTSTEKSYKVFKKHIEKHAKPIVVAVIDSGVDITHKEFKKKIWKNEKEINGNPGVDDDGNGYIDDFYGWNFLGNNKGENVSSTTLEVTREFKRLSDLEKTSGLDEEQKKYFERVKKLFEEKSKEAATILLKVKKISDDYNSALEILKKVGLKNEKIKSVQKIEPTSNEILDAKNKVLAYLEKGKNSKYYQTRIEFWAKQVEVAKNYYFNINFNSSDIVGDDPSKMDDIGYGNNDVLADDGEHGTHVAGIIAARRHNWAGIKGQADNVQIMSLRAVPDGDERDKDIANAIYYAVNNGARIINMSFGKPLSPNRDYVMAAIKYAESKNVLIVHAAGNDNKNLDSPDSYNYPSRKIVNSDQSVENISTWIEVGASSALIGKELPADFSNFGKTSVDLFAPGVKVMSTIPNKKYAAFSGTSMAAPEVSGVAALIWSQFPHLKASQIRELLMKSSRQYGGLLVTQPGNTENDQPVLFSDLSICGGILSTFNAMKTLLTL